MINQSFPVSFLGTAPLHQPQRQPVVPTAHPVAGPFCPALPDQPRQQPWTGSQQVSRSPPHQPHSLPFRRHIRKDFRILGVGNPQIEISGKLLSPCIVVGMNDPGIRRVRDFKTRLHRPGREDHILVENRGRCEPSQPIEHIPSIGRAYVGAKIGLNSQPRQIRLPLHRGSLRVVELSGKALDPSAILLRQLSGVCYGNPPLRAKSVRQAADQFPIRRQRILSHAHKNIRIG